MNKCENCIFTTMWNDIPEMGCMLIEDEKKSIEEYNKQAECGNKFTYAQAKEIINNRKIAGQRKMSDEEIEKALECCGSSIGCKNCPVFDRKSPKNCQDMCFYALDYIKRLKEQQ